MLYLGRLASHVEEGPVNTLGNVALELSASRERVAGDPGKKYYYGSRWLQFLKAHVSADGQEPRFVPEMQELGLLVFSWELADRAKDASTAEKLQGRIFRLIPPPLLQDACTHAAFWPGNPALLKMRKQPAVEPLQPLK